MELMDVCRVCLSGDTEYDILSALQGHSVRDTKDTFVDVMLYCLNIQVKSNSKISTKLCFKCYDKILSFYEFKKLAHNSDNYLQSLENDSKVTDDGKDENKYLSENENRATTDFFNTEEDVKIKLELCSNEDDMLQGFESDDELLSVIKQEREETPVMKKRGRPKLKKKSKTENKETVCDECGKTVKNLKAHLRKHLPKSERKLIKCKVCDKMFASYSSRYRHNKIKHLGIKKQCEICKKYYTSLTCHKRLVHDYVSLRHECASCGRRFITQSALANHMTIHTKDRPYKCHICENAYRCKLNLQNHIRSVHNKEKSHMCQFCSKRFFKKYHLSIHIRTHTKEKPLTCPDCGKCFASTTNLKNHQLLHSEVKEFACTVCDMTFKRAGYLSNHMLSHSKEKRHPCRYCGIKFKRSDHKKRHEFTAHEKLNTT